MISTSGRDFDIILVGGEPYVDHPLSGVGVIARVLDAQGYRVGVVGRPDWTRDEDFLRLGRPRLFFGVTAGSIDSLLVNTTPLKRRRSKDAHAPRASGIPDRAVLVYCAKLKGLFPGVPVVIGGIEASLRRFAHYDYWEGRVRRSILLDSRADILVYGPGEYQVVEIARRFAEKLGLDGILGTCVVRHEVPAGFREIPSFEEISTDPDMFCRAQRAYSNRAGLAQKHANRFVIQYPMPVTTTQDLDEIYGLPFSRKIPKDFPEFKMAQFSVVTHRGCFGDCSFCALSLLQGDRIVSRSEESILDEIRGLTAHPDFKGFIDDLGGPTANMYGMDCVPGCAEGVCLDCRRLNRSHNRLIRLMKKARSVPGVKKVFVRSGIRYDLAMDSPEYLEELSAHHLSGLLKIAPEHVAPAVLRAMNKDRGSLDAFRRLFRRINRGKQQHLAYYFMVAHPGSGDKEAHELGRALRVLEKEGERPAEGIQIFTPTPLTRSTCMYHTGMNPETGKPIFVPRSFDEKKTQRRAALGR